ncbi:hypothetical protein Tco_0839586 [Tanacetum coccineum]|uniref:Retrotransposon gag domain-containing protein n=1 Tax=Tanacetum coccineum TaxID=301880 RepID=A0ABQ5AW22_9ASTR
MSDVDINTLAMEQYLVTVHEDHAPGVVRPDILQDVNFEIRRQFMRELREDTFSGNKNDDAYKHMDKVLYTARLFHMMQSIKMWDLLKKAFIQIYCPPLKTKKQLEEIHNFKQEEDETLYQAWQRYNDLLYKCPTHDLNVHQKRIADHSQKWHDGSIRMDIGSSSDGIATITNRGTHMEKDCPRQDTVKILEEVKYGKLGRPFNGGGNRHRVGPPDTNLRNQTTSIKSLDTQFNQLEKVFEAQERREAQKSQVMAMNTDKKKHQEKKEELSSDLHCQIPPTESDTRKFTIPYSIGDFTTTALADLGANINVMPKNMFDNLNLGSLKKTCIVVEMADMSKKVPLGMDENF